MSIFFVTIQGGLGNQLFQAALICWMQANWDISAQPLDPGKQAKPGKFERSCQIDQLFPKLRIRRGCLSYLIHILSLSRKWQSSSGKFGLVCRIADEDSLQRIMRGNLQESTFKRFFKLYVFSGHIQSLKLIKSVMHSMIAHVRPVLSCRASRIDNMLSLSKKPPLASTLVVHVRRGDILTLQNSFLLEYNYYKHALDALKGDQSFCPTAVAVVSDQPETAIALIQQLSPSAYLLDLDDPIDVLSAMATAYGLVLANSTLSLWGAIFSTDRHYVVGPSIPFVGECSWSDILAFLEVRMVGF